MFQRAHIVQAVGQLNQDDADIVDHREDHLAQVLGLLLFPAGEVNGTDLGDSLDDVCYLFAELFADIHDRDRSIFHRIVKQSGNDGHGVHFHFRQHQRYFERMYEVWLSGRAGLAGVVLLGVLVGFADQPEVVIRASCAHAAHEFAKLGDGEDVGRELFAQSRHEGL